MAVNKINQSKRNYARPTPPTITSATTSATTTDIVVSWTPSVYGPPAANYTIVSSTNSHSHTQSKTTSATSITMNQPGGAAYEFLIQAIGPAGTGKNAAKTSLGALPPRVWGLFQTYNSSQTLTVPAGYAKMAAIVISGGGGGGTGNEITYSTTGGGGAAGLYFKDLDVTPGETMSITVGGGAGAQGTGGTSSIYRNANATTIATANGGTGGSSGNTANWNWTQTNQIRYQETNTIIYNNGQVSSWGVSYRTGSPGGTWSSNVAGAVGANGASSSNSGSNSRSEPFYYNGWSGQVSQFQVNAGGASTLNIDFINYNASYTFGGGGGSSPSGYQTDSYTTSNYYNSSFSGYSGGNAGGYGANGGGQGGRGRYGTSTWSNSLGSAGGNGGFPGGGGGGGGWGASGGSGGSGVVYVYFY